MMINKELVEYFTKFIENIVYETKLRLFRYATPPESPFWVALDGFKVSESEQKKMCTTLSPVFYTYVLGRYVRGVLIKFDEATFDLVKATSYTSAYPDDPVSGERTFSYEMELSVYYKPEFGYNVSFVSIDHIDKAYLLRDVKLIESDYKKSKVLPQYLHDRTYAIYPYTLINRNLLIKQLAVLTIVRLDHKMDLAFAYSWDKYWDSINKLASRPNYAYVESLYLTQDFFTYYDIDMIKSTCRGALIPSNVCDESFINEIINVMRYIYGLVGVEIYVRRYGASYVETYSFNTKSLKLYYKFFDILETPENAEKAIKWWFKDLESLENYLTSLRVKQYEPKVSPEEDPNVYIIY